MCAAAPLFVFSGFFAVSKELSGFFGGRSGGPGLAVTGAQAQLTTSACIFVPQHNLQPVYPHEPAPKTAAATSECQPMIYTGPMAGRDTGSMNGMTRRSPASRGAGETWLWHGWNRNARGARGRQRPLFLPWPAAPTPPIARHISSSSAPLRVRPPAPIMLPKGTPRRPETVPILQHEESNR